MGEQSCTCFVCMRLEDIFDCFSSGIWEFAYPQDAVTVVGYPIGGDTISITSGVVSQMENLSYVHGSTELLGLQIDAAINSRNPGGPDFNDKRKCVGISFQSSNMKMWRILVM
ncbi:hypothetical protein RJ641_016597 [Dillenia turbinata]|uniref:Uncharacterized protein n=1 Tax=Dillenia turbinata TaxID=194707 RepID=A0AAN8UM80_9MAGN